MTCPAFTGYIDRVRLVVSLLAVTLLSACGRPVHRSARDATPAVPSPCATSTVPFVPLVAKEGAWPSSRCIADADALIAKMTVAQKAAQMLQLDMNQVRDTTVLSHNGLGSLLAGGESDPPSNEVRGWAAKVGSLRAASLAGPHGIPILFGIDAVHGHNNVRGAVLFPHNIGLGATRDAELVEQVGRITALEVAASGIDWTFAPVLAAVRDERWGRTYEGFGETPELAETLGAAMIRGLQGQYPGAAHPSVLACAKHFVGDGATRGGVDQGDAQLTPEQTEALLRPYRAAIAANVGSVMASFSSLNGVRMHCNAPLLAERLKGELGFRGFVVSDWDALEMIPGQYPDVLAAAIESGVDLFMAPRQSALFGRFVEYFYGKRISAERIDDAVRRILAVKCELGMLHADSVDPSTGLRRDFEPRWQDEVGSEAHRAVARRAVRESLVVLKNEGSLLPLSKAGLSVHVAGGMAADIGVQSGGWTISWQGGSGPLTTGTTILRGIQEVSGNPMEVANSVDGRGAERSDVIIAVIGEDKPYAEGMGDRKDLTVSAQDVALIDSLSKKGKPLVALLVTGRPLLLAPILDKVNALVVVWLPGTEGAGIADVLYGDYPPVGTLPHSWPREMAQIPINVGDAQYDPLFPYGFGLTWPARDAAGAPPVETRPEPPLTPPSEAPGPQSSSAPAGVP